MRLLRWLPWRFFATRAARAYGFLDPIQLLARLRQFSKPSEVGEPIELLRAGVLFHARGLINTKAIQNNLDWVWPYWVERQFNPADHSFIPRAFSFSHINLTHRNWTAVGLPDVPYYPIVDPRGLVTPLFDGWSLDFWLIGPGKHRLLPSKLEQAEQELEVTGDLFVRTVLRQDGESIQIETSMDLVERRPNCVVRVRAESPVSTHLAVVVRPYNPEGISFIKSITLLKDRRAFVVNDRAKVLFDDSPERCAFSSYQEGDVLHLLPDSVETTAISCPVSMATAAALFPLESLKTKPLEVRVPIVDELKAGLIPEFLAPPTWGEAVSQCSRLQIPDAKLQRLYEQAAATLILHSPHEVYPGPYTYKRFWFRDAAFLINALITLGAKQRSKRALDLFPKRQLHNGYFLSQEGEWDSNGEAIWIMHRYLKLAGEELPSEWAMPIERGAHWILRKRLPKDLPETHAGLLPAGFSAEHLGPNDYYYWDNFWGVAGLWCAADLLRPSNSALSKEFSAAAEEYLDTITNSFRLIPDRERRGAISASPHRRMDAGAIGSLVADYPLQLFPPGEIRLRKTVEFLMSHGFYGGGFFQNMIHSGINAYLTLHIAQVLLRSGDARALELVDAVANLASPTGQWPEAIHPQTLGGCMGDGQHVWAAAEWVLMIRNLFIREERSRLVIGSGLAKRWLDAGTPMSLQNALTPFGPVNVYLHPLQGRAYTLVLDASWRGDPPPVTVEVPGYIATRCGLKHEFSLRPEV